MPVGKRLPTASPAAPGQERLLGRWEVAGGSAAPDGSQGRLPLSPAATSEFRACVTTCLRHDLLTSPAAGYSSPRGLGLSPPAAMLRPLRRRGA